jgi:Dpy-30 motif
MQLRMHNTSEATSQRAANSEGIPAQIFRYILGLHLPAAQRAAMDSDYLKRSIGGPLSDALVAMVVAQPEDSVQFLGEALLDYVRRAEDASKRSAYAAKLQIKLDDAQREEAAAAKVGKLVHLCSILAQRSADSLCELLPRHSGRVIQGSR